MDYNQEYTNPQAPSNADFATSDGEFTARANNGNNQVGKNKHKFPWLGILALMLVCTLLGGVVGGFITNELLGMPNGLGGGYYNSASVTDILQKSAENKAMNIDDSKTLVSNTDSRILTPSEIGEKASLAVVAINTQTRVRGLFGGDTIAQGAGSGVLISADGVIVTNNHVINHANTIVVNLANGKKYDAKVIGQDPNTDIAVVKIEGSNFPYLTTGDSGALRMGDQVVAIGNPLGELEGSLTVGYISATNRNLSVREEDGSVMTMYGLLQTDAAINRGNSGGALINMYGELIGINSMKTSAVGVEGLGFAIPINTVKPIVEDLLKFGRVKNRPTIGVVGKPISDKMVEEYEYPHGLYILSVVENGSAEAAGIKKGDVITAINGHKVSTYADINGLKNQLKAGDKITVEIYRNGEITTVELILKGED